MSGRSRTAGSLSRGRYKYKASDGKLIGEHVLIAEAALGRRLPDGAIVHHVNEIRSDNRNENLVICPDRAYHNLIHARMRALAACGHANWMICSICKKYDAPENLYHGKRGGRAGFHRSCHAAKQLSRWRGDRTDIRQISKKGAGKRYYSKIASKALGHPVPLGASVFRIAGNTGIVICPSDSYRKLLNTRYAALSACGNSSWRKCQFCGEWSDPATMSHGPLTRTIPQYYHKPCRNDYLKRKRG